MTSGRAGVALLGVIIGILVTCAPARAQDHAPDAARAAAEQRRYDDAERHCRSIVAGGPGTSADGELASIFLLCGDVALRRAQWDDAARRYDLALGLARHLYDDELRTQGEASTALLAFTRGRYEDAERRFLDLLDPYRDGRRSDDVLKERLLNNLGGVYERLGRLADAERVWTEALTLAERRLGPSHEDVGTKLDNLAAVYGKMQRWTESDTYADRAIRIFAERLGENDPTLARALDNLGRRLAERKRYADAERLHRRALAIFTTVEGPSHPDVAITLMNLGTLAFARGRTDTAENDITQALDIRRRSLGAAHPATLDSLAILGELYAVRGRHAEAERVFREWVNAAVTALGEEHPHFVRVLAAHAQALHLLGRPADAAAVEQRRATILARRDRRGT